MAEVLIPRLILAGLVYQMGELHPPVAAAFDNMTFLLSSDDHSIFPNK